MSAPVAGAGCDIGEREIDRKLARLRDDFTARVEHRARPVEHQIVLSTDLVDEHQRQTPATRGGRQHPWSQVPLFDRERRRRDVDNEISPGIHELLDRIVAVEPPRPKVGVVPDVFTNRDPQAPAAKRRDGGLGARLKIPPFVEHVVRRQQRLATDGDHLAVFD